MSDRTLYHREYYRENRATTTKIRKPPTPPPDPVPDPENMWAVSKSYENLIIFYRDELLVTLHNPTLAPKIPIKVSQKLRRDNELRIQKVSTYCLYILSPRACRLLKSLEKNKMKKIAQMGLYEISPDVGYPVPGSAMILTDMEEVKK